MTGQPDVAGAVLALDRAMIALAVAKSTLLGEVGPAMLVPSSGPDPYGSAKHGVYTAPSAAAVAQDVEPRVVPPLSKPWRLDLHVCGASFDTPAPTACPDTAAHHEPPAATGHLPQHTHGEPGCTYCGKDHAAVTR